MIYKTLIHLERTNKFITIFSLVFFYVNSTNYVKLYKSNQINIKFFEFTKSFMYLYYKILITCFLTYFSTYQITTLNKAQTKFNILKPCFVYKDAQLHYEVIKYNINFLFKLEYKLSYFRYINKKIGYLNNSLYSKKII